MSNIGPKFGYTYVQSTSENQKSEIRNTPKSEQLLVRISDNNLRPKSEQNRSDFGCFTKLDRLSQKGVINLYIYINGPA